MINKKKKNIYRVGKKLLKKIYVVLSQFRAE